MTQANLFLEQEHWPEWNARFARPVKDFPHQHRPLTAQLNLASILCHVEERVIANDYTISFAGQRYQLAREEVQAGMRRQLLRIELRLDGELHARFAGRYLSLHACDGRPTAPGANSVASALGTPPGATPAGLCHHNIRPLTNLSI